ncbi:alkaline phosphatase PafA [Muriicola sp. Z0-33]|uniref:alkaline phosphatase PafA n=1 Tax=Muriicola sp. Z0-33 TaxID=2816957 RepID=UPI0022375A95|nr:alkaline phosphatase PafA [Muriicola sp. Z0-33]MCW5517339.1 alkaline phosphatase family protein [Muriicola sp. Z0-33]
MKNNFIKKVYLLLCFLLFAGHVPLSHGQSVNQTPPKLVVGIVVDQMSYEQLYKYKDKLSNGGFVRLMRDGFNYKNTQYNYIPTVTAAGHSSIYTGTTPATHGIIGNSWFQREENNGMGNVDDPNEHIIGAAQENNTGLSPKNLLSTTISDQLRLATNFRSKVISVSLKDRGAILPGGHLANAAYWHDWKKSPGYFVSSSYYMNDVPDWVKQFNKQEKSNAYLDTTWNTLLPIESYVESAADDNSFERTLGGKTAPTFPYEFKKMRERYRSLNAEYQLIWASPFGNTLLTEFALAALENEALGVDEHTDMLNISYSVPDAVGHALGPQSVEIQDIYLRLDRDIESLLNKLDEKLGDKYLLFLTSDHGAIPTASYLNANKIPTGIAPIPKYRDTLANYLIKKHGRQNWIQHFDYEHVYLNRDIIRDRKLNLAEVQQDVASFLSGLKWIRVALSANDLQTKIYYDGLHKKLQNGFHPKRSGDILLSFEPGIIMNADPDIAVSEIKGTTHGSGYAYDSHVPLLWYGKNIPNGSSVRKVSVIDIAPSLAMFLNVQLPSGCSGVPLEELFR